MKLRALFFLALFLVLPVTAAELRIDTGRGVRTYSTAQLLARSDVQTISLPADVAYRRPMRYRAVPLRALLDGVMPTDHLQFVATDGFAAEVPAALLWGDAGRQAWLAIENPSKPWPLLAGKRASAGPFYLVWTQPRLARIDPEQWPYQLASIRRLAGIATRFPAILPDLALPADSAVARGFTVFQRTCFACHTLNGEGDARLGPDLNIPHNPVEYLPADLLRSFIRNPQSLRRWPQAKMHGFDAQALSDEDLDDVLIYLRHMAGRKTAH